MIKNQRQYRITKAQLHRLERALTKLIEGAKAVSEVHPILHKVQVDALRSQIDELGNEIAEYESLAGGEKKVLELCSFDELPRALIQARIAAGLSQRELAEKLGLKEQQIQRYECTEYASSSISRIKEVIKALGVQIREEVFLPSTELSLPDILKHLQQVGVDRDLILERLVPRSLATQLKGRSKRKTMEFGGFALQLAGCVSRVFGWSPAAVLSRAQLGVSTAPLGAVRLKAYSRTQKRRLTAYTVYAHYLALLLFEATSGLSQGEIPTKPHQIYEEVVSQYGSMNLKHVLTYVWDLGVPVLPLNDRGVFHGACWRIDGRNIIVLKQRTTSQSRWLFDLLHELWHATQEPSKKDRTFVEAGDHWQDRQMDEEEEAGQFAGDVMLKGRAEELAQMCVEAASGSVERLKKALPRVAVQENVSVDALANYMAFRLSLQKINWWGTANKLQKEGELPFHIARDILLGRTNFARLNELDRELFLRAMFNGEILE